MGHRFGFHGFKFKTDHAGSPDHIFLADCNKIEMEHVFWIEFKKPEGTVKGNQGFWQDGLKRLGYRSYIVWHLKGAEKVFERERTIYTARLSTHID